MQTQTNDEGNQVVVDEAKVQSQEEKSVVGSSSSFDESSSDDEEDEQESERNGLSLAERRALKVERNNAFLQSLGLLKPKKRFPFHRSNNKAQDGDQGVIDEADGGATTAATSQDQVEDGGMLLPPIVDEFIHRTTTGPKIPHSKWQAGFQQHLIAEFPGRKFQVQQLMSLLVWCADESTLQNSMPPLFLTGSHGTGKTAIAKAICDGVVARACTCNDNRTNDHGVLYSYINAATQGNSWIGQIRMEVEQKLGLKKSKKRRKRVDGSKKPKKRKLHEDSSLPADDNQESSAYATRPRRSSRNSTTNQANYSKKHSSGKERSKQNATAQDMFATTQEESVLQHSSGAADSTRSIAVHALGRFLQSTLRTSGARMILVLDQAELLLDESASAATSHKPNVLAQLLLLPRTFDLPLSIVVISNSIFLGNSRLNRMVESSRSHVSMIGNIQPIQIHFPGYQGTQTFKTMMQTAKVSEMITGQSLLENSSSFQSKVYLNFVHLFVNTMYDSVRDMNELIRMGRLLWPAYQQPLLPNKIQQTFQNTIGKRSSEGNSQKKAENGNEQRLQQLQGNPDETLLLEYLDRKALAQFRQVRDSCLSCLALPAQLTGTKHGADWQQKLRNFDLNQALSRPARYLLLAAYLCQVNRPEQDRSLFSIQKNGRRRKQALTEENTTAMGGGSDGKKKLSTIRLRSFPLERLLSIYVSLVALHSIQDNGTKNSETTAWNSRALSRLQERVGEWLHLLTDVGVLKASSDGLRLTEPRYCCHITAYEAEMVASSLDFPLDRYTL